MTPKDFEEYYSTASASELLSVLENPGDFQPAAIDAAKKELERRNLSEEAILEAKEPLIKKQLQKEKQQETIREIENKVRRSGNTLLETLNPIQEGINTTEKSIRYIVILFTLVFLYNIINDWGLFLAYFHDLKRYPFESSLVLLPLFSLPFTIYFFWKQKRAGWILLTIFLVYGLVEIFWALFYYFTWKPGNDGIITFVIPKPSLTAPLIKGLLYGSILFVICKKNTRLVYNISENQMAGIIAVSTLILFLLTYSAM